MTGGRLLLPFLCVAIAPAVRAAPGCSLLWESYTLMGSDTIGLPVADGLPFFKVNGTPIPTSVVPGSYYVEYNLKIRGTTTYAYHLLMNAPFDCTLFHPGDNSLTFTYKLADFQVTYDHGEPGKTFAIVSGVDLRAPWLKSAQSVFYVETLRSRSEADPNLFAPNTYTKGLTLTLEQVDPQLAQELRSLREALARDIDKLVELAGRLGAVVDSLPELRNLQSQVESLMTRDWDDIDPADLDAFMDQYTHIPTETRDALKRLLDDLKSNVRELRAELQRIGDEFAQKSQAAANAAAGATERAGAASGDALRARHPRERRREGRHPGLLRRLVLRSARRRVRPVCRQGDR